MNNKKSYCDLIFKWKTPTILLLSLVVLGCERSPQGEIKKAREALIHSSAIWSSHSCLRSNFGQAIDAGMKIPPEISFFCAYPWDLDKLSQIVSELKNQGLTPESLIANASINKNTSNFIVRILAATRELPMPNGVMDAHDLFKVLPLVWSAHPSRPDHQKMLSTQFTPEFLKTLTKVSSEFDWKTSLTGKSIRAVRFGEGIGSTILFTDQLTYLQAEDAPSVILAIQMPDRVREMIAKVFPGEGNFMREIQERLTAEGLHAKHMVTASMVEAYGLILEASASAARSDLKELARTWVPAQATSRNSDNPLEIYWLEGTPEKWCGKPAENLNAQYCFDEDRIFVKSGAKDVVGPGSVDLPLSVSAPLLHEMAHAFLNPVDSKNSPFVTEGLVTAYGERSLRGIAAAIPAAKLLSLEDVQSMISRTLSPPESSREIPLIPSGVDPMNFAKQQIENSPHTRYTQSALCTLVNSPMTSSAVLGYLSKSSGMFFELDANNLKMAYAYAWAIFHFGLDGLGIGQGFPNTQIDASIIQDISSALSENKKISEEQDAALNSFISKVNTLARNEATHKSLSCV